MRGALAPGLASDGFSGGADFYGEAQIIVAQTEGKRINSLSHEVPQQREWPRKTNGRAFGVDG